MRFENQRHLMLSCNFSFQLGNLIFIPTTNIDGSGGCEITNDYGK